MKMTFADLKPTEQQLARINQLAKGQLTAAEVAVFPLLVIDSQPTVYSTIPDRTWFEQAVRDINGDEGVSLQLNHDTYTLPVGRLFHAELVTSGDSMTLLAMAYTRDAALVEKYLAGEVQAVSAGLSKSWYKCSICGNRWMSDECISHARKNKDEYHWPGERYDGVVCHLYYMVDEGGIALREVSPVYKGASAGRMLSPEKIKELFNQLRAEAGVALNLADGTEPDKAALDASREQLEKQALTLEFKAGSVGSDGSDGSGVSAEAEMMTKEEHQRLLDAQLADAAKREGELLAQVKDMQVKLDAAQAATQTESALKDGVKRVLAGVLGAFSAVMTALHEAKQVQEMPADEQAAEVAVLANMGMALRTYLAARVEKLAVQLDGNKAGDNSAYARGTDALALVTEIERLEQALAAKYKVQPLTSNAEKENPARPRLRNQSFKMKK